MMKQNVSLCLIGLMGLVGCAAQEEPAANSDPSSSVQSAAASAENGTTATFVNLKVPNMVWGACAASVRGDLSKIAGITEIKTDPNARICTFKVTDPSVDYQAAIAKFAETNTHLQEFSFD